MSESLRKGAKQLVGEAKSAVENLTPDQVERELASGEAVLIDLRDSDERAKNGVIPGAVHVTRGMLEFRADPSTPYHEPALQPDRRIILHCASGGRSALGAKTLQEMGYANVAHLDGGINAWKESGRTTEPSS